MNALTQKNNIDLRFFLSLSLGFMRVSTV